MRHFWAMRLMKMFSAICAMCCPPGNCYFPAAGGRILCCLCVYYWLAPGRWILICTTCRLANNTHAPNNKQKRRRGKAINHSCRLECPFYIWLSKRGGEGCIKRQRERYNATQSGGCSSTKKDGQTVDTK